MAAPPPLISSYSQLEANPEHFPQLKKLWIGEVYTLLFYAKRASICTFSRNLCRFPFRVRQINIGPIVQTDSANLGESENKPAPFSVNKCRNSLLSTIYRYLLWAVYCERRREQIFTRFHLNFRVSLIFRLVQGPISRIKCLYICIQSAIEINQMLS